VKSLRIIAVVLVLAVALGLSGCAKQDKQNAIDAFNTAKEKVTQQNSTLKSTFSAAEDTLKNTSKDSVLDASTLASLQQTLSSTSTETGAIPEIAADTAAIKKQTDELNKSYADLQTRISQLNTAVQSVNDSKQALADKKQQEAEAKQAEAASLNNVKTLSWEDDNGYKFLATARISSWVKASDSNLVNQAGKQAGWNVDAQSLMDDVNYYLTAGYGSPQAQVSGSIIAFGTLTFQNVTPEFHISSSNALSPGLPVIFPVQSSTGSSVEILYYISSSNSVNIYPFDGNSAQMDTDTYGPIPFAVVIYNYFTPKTPNGPKELDLSLSLALQSPTNPSVDIPMNKTW